ncbi:MAG: malto-oligosyltrehalose synthase [Desulfobacterales bacterium]
MEPDETKAPLATYRVQLGPHLSFDHLTGLLPYFRDLGISHLYLSPCFKAAAGSTHGYDVVDPSAVNSEFGGEDAFERLNHASAECGIGLMLDIVPNHMAAAGRQNRWWMDVLSKGRRSRYADFFDIRWDHPDPSLCGKVLLPVLGDEIERCLELRQIRVRRRDSEIYLEYFEHEFPVSARSLRLLPLPAEAAATSGGCLSRLDESITAINSDPGRLAEFLDLQHYRLALWRKANREINYRRFFDIHQLVGVCVERDDVFAATHWRILEWVRSCRVDGLRIDHPDGLSDPASYLQRLRRAAPTAWVVVEKILEPDEALPGEWPVAGTTGYDFLNVVNGLFVDPRSEKILTEFYSEWTGSSPGFREVVIEKKRLVLEHLFQSELDHLLGLLRGCFGRRSAFASPRPSELERALTDVIACFPVYRTYIRPENSRVEARDRSVILKALAAARQQRPEIASDAWAQIEDLLLLRQTGSAEGEFVRRFQQLTGPVMAKGVEDTAFYCFNRLISLNEVGGNPGQFGTLPEAFHAFCRRIQSDWPQTLLASATHDTKRGEDSRLRIGLLSEIPERWTAAVRRWSRTNAHFRRSGFPDPNTEYFLYQTLVGAWPIGGDRLVPAMLKAAREAKVHTSWLDPAAVFEDALEAYVNGMLGNREFTADLSEFLKELALPTLVSSLSQTLIKCTAPGVPDIYQGTELWDFSLVDPDNRRPVDFEVRRRRLAEIGALSVEEVLDRACEGLQKLFLIERVLAIRRRIPEPFGREGSYEPLTAEGERSDHLVAFIRGGRAVTLAPRLVVGLGGDWKNTTIELPAGDWEDLFSRERFSGGTCELARVLGRFPVALLIRSAG